MIRSEELRQQIVSYIANEISFDSFEDWLLDRCWNIHKDSDVELQQWVHEVNASIFKYLDSYINEEALKRELLALVKEQNVSLIVSEGQAPVIQQRWKSQTQAYFAHAAG